MLTSIKKKLQNSANMIPIIVGDNFLKNAYSSPSKNSESKIWKKVYLLTKYCQYHQIISTTILGIKKNSYYILISGLDSPRWKYNLKHKIRTKITYNYNYSTYKNGKSAKYCQSFLNSNKNQEYMKPTDTSEGFSYIILLKRFELSNGRLIVTLSAIYLSHIDQMLFMAVLDSLFVALFFSLIGIPFVILLKEKFKMEKIKLEKKVKFRTNQLRLEKTKVEQANKAKDQFFANMSHDFRTPLNAIMGFSKQIHSNKFDNQQLSKYINLSASYMLNFTEDLLDFTKIENDNLEYIEEIVNLEEVIMMVNECYALKAYEEGKKFKLILSNDLPLSIESSKRRLFQIINNLVSNSMKFIKKGQEVKLKVYVNKKNKLEIIIQDNGIGIEKENLDKIFEKFYKADTKNNGSGVGLGLFITKTIVENMKGNIKVESELNKFSKFTVTLPLKEISKKLNFENMYDKYLERNNFKSEARKNKSLKEFIDETCEYLEMLKNSAANNDSQSVEAYSHKIAGMADNAMLFELEYYARKIEREALKQDQIKKRARIDKYCKILEEGINKLPYPKKVIRESKKELKIKKILIVDDTLYNAKILNETLYDLGYGSDFVLSGKEALEMVETKNYEVVFIDINMPDMDGKQLFVKLKQMKIKAYLIAFTADKTDETRNSLLKLGFDEIFDKRISEGQLARILEKFLG